MIFILLCIFLSGASVSHVAHPKSCVSSESVLKYLGLDCCLGLYARAFCLSLYVVDFALLSPARALHAVASISTEMMHRWMECAKRHAIRLCRYYYLNSKTTTLLWCRIRQKTRQEVFVRKGARNGERVTSFIWFLIIFRVQFQREGSSILCHMGKVWLLVYPIYQILLRTFSGVSFWQDGKIVHSMIIGLQRLCLQG